MAKKIKCIVKYCGEPAGHVEWVGNDLESLQDKVEGPIETVTICQHPKVVMICNEEGKLRDDLQPNFFFGLDLIFGDVVVCGVNGDDLADVPITLDAWRMLLKKSGNDIGR
jgi:hypothetical protein